MQRTTLKCQQTLCQQTLPAWFEMEEAANGAASVLRQTCGVLLELGRDAREGVVELSAQAIDHSDDRDRNAGGDQSVLDGGSARVVFQEMQNKPVHWSNLCCPIPHIDGKFIRNKFFPLLKRFGKFYLNCGVRAVQRYAPTRKSATRRSLRDLIGALLLALVAEADAKLVCLLAQRAHRTLHLLRDFNNWRVCL